MRVFSIAKGFHRLWKLQTANLGQKELDRLRAIRIFKSTADVKLTCATFGISRATLYRWVGRFDSRDLRSLSEQSRRPKRLRKPKWSFELLKEVKQLRRQYPRWGKDKLVVLLRDQGWKTSTSTVGRIINCLKRRGDIVEPKRPTISSKKRQIRTYAIRKPADYRPQKRRRRTTADRMQSDSPGREFRDIYL